MCEINDFTGNRKVSYEDSDDLRLASGFRLTT